MKPLTWIVPLLAAIAALVVIERWLAYDPAAALIVHEPGLDGAPESEQRPGTVEIGAFFARGDGEPAESAGSWPRFRGAHANNTAVDGIRLADQWDDTTPRVVWWVETGEGHAGAAVHNGRVYVLDYDEDARRDVLRCLSLADGREIWRRGYAVEIRRNHGMSRTVPAATDRYVVTLGPLGHVMGVDAATGDFLWGLDLVADYATVIPMWYTGQCPLIVDDVAIIAPAGPAALMIGVDCATGTVLWSTPNAYGLAMSHSSIVPATLHGVRMFLYAALGGLVGIAAEGKAAGEVLWFAPQWDRSVIAPVPVVLDDERIFVTAGYGGGSMLLRIEQDDHGRFRARTIAEWTAREGLASEQQTPVLVDGHLIGILPNDAGPLRNQLVCVHPDNPHEFVWVSGYQNRFGLGPYLVADGKLYVLRDDGLLVMVEATAEAFRELGRRRLFDGHDAWGPMALVDGCLILRDDTRMFCVDVR